MSKIAALVEYFASGCKKEKLLGVEIEHFVVDRTTRESLPYDGGVEEILTRLAGVCGEPIFSDGRIIGLSSEDFEISLEPAAQLEISISPTASLEKIRAVYEDFLAKISLVLREKNAELFCAGYHPKSKIADLPLIPKKRYYYMYEHFKKTGTHGAYMMKGTASTQINIDYASEADFAKKFHVANALSPIFSYICDSARVFEGEPYAGRMLRTHIWNNVDPARSGIVPGALGGDFGFRDYAEYICALPQIFPHDEDDLEHITSMAFLDVRLKNRIEIRVADSMAFEKNLEFTALVKDIFYDEANLEKIFLATQSVRNPDAEAAKRDLIAHGDNAVVYGKPIKEWCNLANEKSPKAN